MKTSNHDVATGQVMVRDLTPDEIAQLEAKTLANQEFLASKAAAKAELLERLGITADEAALLLS